ncbi:MAG: hypothetical protein NTV86_03255 [Planctomycetota bacterium]|nr:hypothetical protein [Planctomycetota bacterium]
MPNTKKTAVFHSFLALVLSAAALVGGCHTPYQCVFIQGAALGTVQPPLPPEPGSTEVDPARQYVGGTYPPPPPEGDAYKVTGYRPGIRFYVVQYTPNLYRGGDILSREGAQSLKALGVKTIISVDPSDEERALAKEYHFWLAELPFGSMELSRAHLEQFMTCVRTCPGPIYVHCFGGDLRAGILLAYYRMHKQGWSFDRAYTEYQRLDANNWDAAPFVQVLKDNAG